MNKGLNRNLTFFCVDKQGKIWHAGLVKKSWVYQYLMILLMLFILKKQCFEYDNEKILLCLICMVWLCRNAWLLRPKKRDAKPRRYLGSDLLELVNFPAYFPPHVDLRPRRTAGGGKVEESGRARVREMTTMCTIEK